MNFSRQFLLVVLALGMRAGLAMALEPAPATPAKDLPELPLTGPIMSVPQDGPAVAASSDHCCVPGHGGLIGGVGLYLIQPYFQNNLAFGVQQTVGRTEPIPPGTSGTRADSRVDISHHMDIAPLVWLGYMNDEGWGGRVRYWYFRQGTSQTEQGSSSGSSGVLLFSAAPLGLSLSTGADLTVTSELEMQLLDIEAVGDYRAGSWDLLFSAGVRLARVEQTYNAYISQSNANTLLSSHTFDGVGPTLALEARRPFGESGLVLYGSARGSIVIGSAHQDASLPDQNVVASDHRDRGLPIGELELGLEYGRNVGKSRFFGQVALVGQDWFGAGSASRSSVNVVPGGSFVGGAFVGDSDIDFLGVAFRLGVNY